MLELDGATLTYEEFRRCCLEPNHPAIIRNACRSADVTYFDVAALLRRLNPHALIDALGPRALVPVYPNCSTVRVTSTEGTGSASRVPAGDGSAVTSSEVKTTRAADPVRHENLEKEDNADDDEACMEVHLASVLQSWVQRDGASEAVAATLRVYYLKDWHLQEALEHAAALPNTAQQGGQDCSAQRAAGVHGNALYRVPAFLGADWMDPFCRYVLSTTDSRAGSAESSTAAHGVKTDAAKGGAGTSSGAGFGNNRSDYRFAYIGPVGTWTPLHCDVFGTYSWSFNVCGEKLWFFPTVSGNTYLHEHLLPFFPTPPDLRVLTGFEMMCVEQHPGDLVFVPARFYHQVHNITGVEFPLPCAAQHDEGGRGAWTGSSTTEAKECHGEANPSFCSLSTVGPLTMALNHNWCNAFNIECMTRAFLTDAQRLVSHLSVDDLAVICGTAEVEVWREYLDAMLHNGTNWSYKSMTSFLTFCVNEVEGSAPCMVAMAEEREEALARVRRLLHEVKASHDALFCL
jgi:hypothetical protein